MNSKDKTTIKNKVVKTIESDGTIYYKLNNKLHREDGPAIECPDRYKAWYKNGKLHRDDGPAIECADGERRWCKNGEYHREDGPAIEYANGYKEWCVNGVLHREDGPAVEYVSGAKSWYLNNKQYTEEEFNKKMNNKTKTISENKVIKTIDSDGTIIYKLNNKLHREDGPAVEYADGDKHWYKNGKRHRDEGPAIEYSEGTKYWYKNGKLHRDDGPTIEYSSGNKKWYLNGVNYTEEEFNKKINNKKKTGSKGKVVKTINSDGTIFYKLNNKLHREDGPAIEYFYGDKLWYKNGSLHREDGPAIECINGNKGWYLNDVKYTEVEFNKKMNNKKKTESKDKVIKTIDSARTIYYKLNNKLHREDGPAVEFANGHKEWYKNGQLHREDGPARENANGDKEWWLNEKRHREGGPAVEHANGDKLWYKNGELHREDGPAVENANGHKEWYKNGQLHREDGPAREYVNGDKTWCLNGRIHREGGPAIERINGNKMWFKNGELHREDGPAIENVNRIKCWYLNNTEYTEEEFNKKVKNISEIINKSETTDKIINNINSNSKLKTITKEIVKRSFVQETVSLAKKTVLELLSLLGIKKNSRIFKFFSSDFSNVIVKSALGLFLMYCPFTQDSKYQVLADELLTQAGVSSLKEAANKILSLLAPQSSKFAALISNIESSQIRVSEKTSNFEDKTSIEELILEEENLDFAEMQA